MDRRQFIGFTALGFSVVVAGNLTACSGLGGKPPSNPAATDYDVLMHFASEPIEKTLGTLGNRVTYFSNPDEFEKEFYQKHLPPEERKHVMAGFTFEHSHYQDVSKREAAIGWFIAKEFPDIKVMWNILGTSWSSAHESKAESDYNLKNTPALIFGNKENGIVKRTEGIYWSPNTGLIKEGLNYHGGPDNISEANEDINYFRKKIPKILGLERRAWPKAYNEATLD